MKNRFYYIKRRLHIASAEEYKRHLQEVGIKIGEHTKFFSQDINIDEQRPWMVEIGDYCKITSGVVVLQHDYSRSVLRRVFGEVVGESKKTIIGNNVFIGMNAVILMGAHIGNNVIIGAGSVVSGHIPDNVVVAGNPAKVIRTIEEHYHIRKKKYVDEAIETFLEFVEYYKREPNIQEMGSFWSLFIPHDKEVLKKYNVFTRLSGDNEQEVIEDWLHSESPLFDSYDSFKNYCYERRNGIDEENGK